jgi:hypothetical protein
MSDALLVELRFRARVESPLLTDMANLMEDVEGLYFAAHDAFTQERPLLPLFLAERRARRGAAEGFSDELLAEIEYAARAVSRLEAAGANPDVLSRLHHGAELLAERQLQEVYWGRQHGGSLSAAAPFKVRKLSMASPLDVVLSIPSEYWMGGGVVLFLDALERKFNVLDRIRTEKAELAARRASAKADEAAAEYREIQVRQAIDALRHREERPARSVEGIDGEPAPFQLETGTVSVEHPERPGSSVQD